MANGITTKTGTNSLTYQVFARKWRPKSFADLVGQDPIKLAISHSLKSGRIHHAYLFCGTRGVGKTTLGRLLAKCLNCEQGVTPEPCGVCTACLAIDSGHFMDLIEVDAASKTRVEDTRELLDNVQYAPTQGRYKIYLIDEVHMLSTHSFNALLKTLEEPPEHVKFILATTDPEKIPATILSRCLKFILRPISEPLIIGHLIKILEKENIAFEKTALSPLAVAAQGSMRDALSLLEQAVLVGEGVLANKDVQQLLGWVAPEIIHAILDAILKKDTSLIFKIMPNLVEMGADFTQVLDSLLEAFYQISLIQHVLPVTTEYLSELGIALELKFYAEQWDLESTQLFYQIGLVGKQELAYAPTQRIGFEMTLLRILAFYPENTQNLALDNLLLDNPSVQAVSIPAVIPAVMPAAENNSLDWPSLINKLALVGFTKMLANNCELSYFGESEMRFTLDKSQQVCLTAERQKVLQEAISHYFNKPVQIKIVLGEVTQTPMQLDIQSKKIRTEESLQCIQNDPLIQSLVQTFGAEVEAITVLDIDKK